jgi:hypothetical protein
MKKKVFLMTLALLCMMAQSVRADKWDGVTYEEPEFSMNWYITCDIETLEGGTSFMKNLQTLTIRNAAQMAYVQKYFCHERTFGTETVVMSSAVLVLETDLDMGDWKPLGSYDSNGSVDATKFTGTFFGNGHTIRINIKGAQANFQGLFRHIGEGGTVRDLHIAGNIDCSGSRLVGGIAGENDGTINNCWVSADVSSGWHNSASAYDAKVGGITGENSGTIQYCCVTGNVKNDDSDVGGIVGCNNKSGTVDNCTFYGVRSSSHSQSNEYIGDYSGTMTNMHNSFTDSELTEYLNIVNDKKIIEYFNRYGYHPGFQLRYLYCDAIQHPFTVTIKNESEGSLTSDVAAARPGQSVKLTPSAGNSIVKVTVRDAESNLQKEWFAPLAASFSFDMPKRDVTVTTTNTTWTGSGTAEDPYLIPSTEAWERIHTTLMSSSTDIVFENTYFKQTADIDITQGIGATGNPNDRKFCGIYDGNNHRINCKLPNPVSGSAEAVAPFHNTNGATIKNLYVTGSISGGIHTAGIIAYTHGNVTIDNCRVAADITCTGSSYSDAHGGGFVGHALDSKLTIKNSLFDGKLTATSNGKGDVRLGVFVGWGGNTVDIQNCAENGSYSGTTANNQTAFCWKEEGNTTPDNSSQNIYLSELGHHEGANKAVKVSSGTDELELSYPDDSYNWQEVYQGAMFKSPADNATAYLIKGQFYTTKGNAITFDAVCPGNWDNIVVSNGETQIAKSSSTNHYSFTLQSDEDVTITATYHPINWIDDGIAATAFSTVDETNKVVTITTPAELALLSKQLYSGTTTGEGWTYKLGADLDMSKYDWTPIGKITDVWDNNVAFAGTFDGQGHTISGIKVTTTGNYFGGSGLFCNVIGGEIINVKLTNSQIEGYHYVGGISGYTNTKTTIKNCFVGSDVTLKASATQAECGGIVGAAYHSGLIQGCYSAAHISSSNNSEFSNVGGIVGDVIGYNMEVCDNVSQAVIVPGTSDEHTRGYVYGSQKDADISNNFYIAAEASNRRYDVRAFKVKLKRALAEEGFELSHTESDCQVFDVSKITKYPNQFTLNGEWYAVAGQPFSFTIPAVKGGATLDNVTANGNALQQDDSGNYSFTASSEVVGETNEVLVSGSPLLTLSNTADNTEMIEAFDGKKVNVKLDSRTLYHDGKWNVICLPFNLSLTGSALETSTCKLKTLESSSFNTEKGTLTLNFTKDNLTRIEAGKPYIIMWAAGEENTVNPVFSNVTISKSTTNVVADKVTFTGSYMPVSLTAGDKTVLYMGGNNKLYYPTSAVTLGSCRAYFKLNGITASDIAQGAKAIVLNFGEEEVVTSIHNSQLTIDNEAGAWYSVAGRRLSGKPTQKGVYIYKGKKVVIK